MSIWAGLAGAASAYAGIKLSDLERKIKEQEKANEEARELRMARARADIQTEAMRERNAGMPIGTPSAEPGAKEYTGFAYGDDGRTVERRSFGARDPGIIAAETAAMEQAALEREQKWRLNEARIKKAERGPVGRGGGGSKGPTAAQQRAAEKQAVAEALEAGGYYKEKGKWFQDAPVIDRETTDDGTINWISDQTEAKRVPAREVQSVREAARAEARGILNVKRDETTAPDLTKMSRDQKIAAAQAEYPNRSREEIIAALQSRGYID